MEVEYFPGPCVTHFATPFATAAATVRANVQEQREQSALESGRLGRMAVPTRTDT